MTQESAEKKFRLLLDMHDSLEIQGERDEFIDELESFLNACNESEAKGEELVPDGIYDTVKDWLKEVCPDSPVLGHVWSEDNSPLTDYDRFLASNPMQSIRTIKDLHCKEVTDFVNALPNGETVLFASLKENGHGIRIVYKNGVLVKAHTRGRSSNGRDITEQLKLILGERNDALAGIPLIEIRGEILLPYSNLDTAKKYNPSIKSAFTGVSSMLRESASANETKLLKFVAYNYFCDNDSATQLYHKFEFLEKWGFETPIATFCRVTKSNFYTQIEALLDKMESLLHDAKFDGSGEEYEYYTDGVVIAINDLGYFTALGSEGAINLGNLALKIGYWEQNIYSGVIEEIIWKKGKTKLTPVARISGTVTAVGNTVSNIPLYAPCYILELGAYVGETIYFRYGGEAGVVPCTSDGRLITDRT